MEFEGFRRKLKREDGKFDYGLWNISHGFSVIDFNLDI